MGKSSKQQELEVAGCLQSGNNIERIAAQILSSFNTIQFPSLQDGATHSGLIFPPQINVLQMPFSQVTLSTLTMDTGHHHRVSPIKQSSTYLFPVNGQSRSLMYQDCHLQTKPWPLSLLVFPPTQGLAQFGLLSPTQQPASVTPAPSLGETCLS